MVSAVNSSATSVVTSISSSSTTAIQAQIARDKKALSECVNCESSKTGEGKANIQKLSGKISTEEAQLREARSSGTANQSADSKSTGLSSHTGNQYKKESGTIQKVLDTNIGKNLDVFV